MNHNSSRFEMTPEQINQLFEQDVPKMSVNSSASNGPEINSQDIKDLQKQCEYLQAEVCAAHEQIRELALVVEEIRKMSTRQQPYRVAGYWDES